MGRLLVYAFIASVVLRMVTGKWPWELWRRSERSQQEAMARSLLGVGRAAGRTEIIEAHRRLLMQVHPDRGGSNDAVHQANNARDVLLASLGHSEMEKS